MPTTMDDSHAQLREGVYLLLIALSIGMMLGRILPVDSIDKTALESSRFKKLNTDLDNKRKELEAKGLTGDALKEELGRIESRMRQQITPLCRPFLSANDRSRWCTVRALVEDDMRVDGAPYAIDKVIQQPNWDTIDMVKHNGHLYSSKPPLLATIMAGVYWPIHHFFGVSLGTNPYEIGRLMLILFNVLPMILYFILLAKLIDRFGKTDLGRIFVMAAAAFGTFLTTFAVTINNHLPAAVCVTVALYAAVRILFDGDTRLRYFILAGLFAALAVTNELPTAAFAAVMMLVLFFKWPRQTLIGFMPAAFLVAVALLGTNWIAHQTLELAYMHRTGDDSWYDYTYERNGKQIESYWNNPVGVDRGEPSESRYALHVLIGHHGIFSLTPIWILSVIGSILWMWKADDPRLRWLAAIIVGLSLICIAFYLRQPLVNRNYGGVASGLRWMFWFSPLWLILMLPAMDAAMDAAIHRPWFRAFALVCLCISVLSASYPTWNPWTQPWIMNFMQYMGWIS